ncbi:MAG: N-6 DNA methylase, partial [Promethearchaeota archaeon CR_4]
PQFLPKKIRKDTAAFYTAVWAADLLAELAVVGSETMICDPACGTGQLLLSAVKSIHSRGKENGRIQVYGSEVNPFAAKVAGTVINRWVRNSSTEKREVEVNILEGDAFHIASTRKKGSYDLVIMNPPFSSQLRLTQKQKKGLMSWVEMQGLEDYVNARMGLHFYFLFLADWYLKESGTLALVIPATTFAGNTARKLLQFLNHQKYTYNFLVEIASLKEAFSIDCCWKEYLLVARKGSKDASETREIQMIRLEKIPRSDAIVSLAEQIHSGREDLCVGEILYGTSKLIPEQTILPNPMSSSFVQFIDNRSFLDMLTQHKYLVPLGESSEIGTFRGFDATYSRYLILPNEFLCNPVMQSSGKSICFEIRNIPSSAIDNQQIAIPIDFLRPCLRDPRSHDVIMGENNEFWLLLIPPDTPKEYFESMSKTYLQPLTKHIEELMRKKMSNGGKEAPKQRKDWYFHPWEYFSGNYKRNNHKPTDLTGLVWTFNRYGLWQRQSVAILTQKPVTANHGCYTYFFLDPHLQTRAEKYWQILVAWFNSTLYLLSQFQHAKTPAKHVQQINLLEHRQMVVPRVARILELPDLCEKIIASIHNLDRWLKDHPQEKLPAQMRSCMENPTHPRRLLDRAWIMFLKGKEGYNIEEMLRVYQKLEELLTFF